MEGKRGGHGNRYNCRVVQYHFVSSEIAQNQKEIAQTSNEKAKFSPAAPGDEKTSEKEL